MVNITVQTDPQAREKTQSRKQTGLRNAIQTRTAFQNLTIKISQWSITDEFSPSTTSICEPLQKLTLSKIVWIWNASYQILNGEAKLLIKDDVCMKFYDETKPLYLETDACGIGLGVTLLQTIDGTTCPRDTAPDNTLLRPITFASKSLTSVEQRYSNIKREVLGILNGFERFHHYCFGREVSIITDHKPLVAIFKNRCGNPVTKNTMQSFQDTPILS